MHKEDRNLSFVIQNIYNQRIVTAMKLINFVKTMFIYYSGIIHLLFLKKETFLERTS